MDERAGVVLNRSTTSRDQFATAGVNQEWLLATTNRIQALVCELATRPELSPDAVINRLAALPRPSTTIEQVIAKGLILDILISADASHSSSIAGWLRGSASRARRPERVSKAVQYIEEHFAKPLKANDVAARAGCHDTTLRRDFKRRLGMSMKEFQTRVRIIKAMTMMRAGGLKLSSIARAVGYQCDKNFYCEFKRLTGFTPATVRRDGAAAIDHLISSLSIQLMLQNL